MLSSLRNALVPCFVAVLAVSAAAQPPRDRLAPDAEPKRVKSIAGSAEHLYTIVDGDIIVDKPVRIPALPSLLPEPESLTTAYSGSLWPKVAGVATVYYTIDAASDPNATPNINTAISTFNADFPGLIQWVAWNSGDGPNYVDFNLNAGDLSGTCEAVEGYEAEPAQPVTGSTNCAVSTILHEMGHVIGLWHEMTRADRNNYVTVNYGNVIKGSWSNFQVVTDNAQPLALFDYASLMEYGAYSFSRNGGPVIETIPAGIPLTSTEGVPVPASADYSAGDKESIQRLYGSAPTQVTVTSNPVGLQVTVDGSTVTTPHTYNWALNSTHTLNVPSGVQSLAGDIEGSTTPTTFYYTYGRWNDSTSQSHTITVTPGNGNVGFPSTSPQIGTYSANFIELVPYSASVYPSLSGHVAVSPLPQTYSGAAGQFFVARQQATLSETPASGYNFYEFSNSPYWLPGGVSASPKKFYVPDTGLGINMTAYFTPGSVYTVAIAPSSSVPDNYVYTNLYLYVDGNFWYAPKTFSPYYDSTWTAGSSHTLNLDSPEYPYSSNSRYAFTSWSDSGAQSHSVASLPAASTNYTATVTAQYAPATNFSYPPCGGTGGISPASPTGDGFYPTGQQLNFSATPDTGWTFAGWTNDLTGTTNPASLTASDETLVFANFNTASAPLTLTSLSPGSAVPGGPAFTLTINGTGFTASSVVFINNIYRASTFVNAQTLHVAMTPADIAAATNFQVFVENYPNGWTGCAAYGALTFQVGSPQLAALVSPTPGSTLSGSSTTFSWTPGIGATAYWLYLGTTGVRTANIFSSGSTTHTSITVNNLPTNGVTLYATLYSYISGAWQPASYTYKESGSYTLAALTSPAPGSTFTGSSAVFSWSPGGGPTAYWLYLGTTGPKSANLFNSGSTTALSLPFNSLPTNGVTVYATLFSLINGTWMPASYTYTEAGTYTLAAITSPAQGSTLAGSTVTFTWSPGAGPTSYFLYLGTTGSNSFNVYSSGNQFGTSVTVNGIPTNGGELFATLFSNINGGWVAAHFTYVEAGTPVLAAITSPSPGSTLSGSSATFTWSHGTGVTAYWLYVGTTGPKSANIYSSGSTSSTSIPLTGLPTNGVNLYVTLYSEINGVWQPASYTYTEAGSYSLAALMSPSPGSTLPGASVTFMWSASVGGTGYWLYLGSTAPKSANLYSSGAISATSVTVNGLPTNGETIYATLFTQINGAWQPMSYTYTAQ